MKKTIFSLVFYGLGAMSDVLITIYMLSQPGFEEKNPNLAPIIGTPEHFIREAIMIVVMSLLVCVFLLLEKSGIRIREKVWILYFLPAIPRWWAVLHNLILLLTGFELVFIFI